MSAIHLGARQGGPRRTSTQVALHVAAARHEAAPARSAPIVDDPANPAVNRSIAVPTALVPAALAAAFPDLAPAALQHILGR
ncbi:hypothetical protein GCM10009759_76200 [Kitasatospora saccharophila]|uniref:FXSXX-COOH protein n=1 Tax=Kitasatospora saccharophila TaxID=407973 RepID=A0ABN2YAG1_9ACTN